METEKVIPTDRKERFSWYLFDLANTSFTVLIVTVLFPRYFSSLADAALGEGLGDVWWGLAGSITMIIIALSSPILGAIADFSGSKKKFLTGYTAVCIIFNLLLFLLRDDIPHFLGVDMWIWAFVLFIISNIGFQGALPFYNAWLPEISDESTIGRIGGYGYAAGYIGALMTIIIAIASLFMFPDYPTLPFLFSGLFFLAFAIPSIMGLKNRPPTKYPQEEGKNLARVGFSRVARTLRDLKNYQGLRLYLVAYFLLSDAITTVIYYASLFAEDVYGFGDIDILIFFAVTQLTAILGAVVFGYIADRFGTKRTLISTLFIWVVALLLAYLGQNIMVWWAVGLLAGIGMGSAQSTARSMYSQYIPEEKKSEMFGLYALTGKFAAILGPLVYGAVLYATLGAGIIEAHRNAMLSILVLFLVAIVILLKVKQPVMGESKVSLEDDLTA